MITTQFEEAVLNKLLRDVDTFPTANEIHIGLFTSNNTEVAYTGYSRVIIPNRSTGFNVSGDTARNAFRLEFPLHQGGSSYTVTKTKFFAVNDTGGTVSTYELGEGNIVGGSKDVTVGKIPVFEANSITFTIS